MSIRSRFIFSLIVTILLLLSSQHPVSAQTTIPGDANGDGKVDGVDFAVWLSRYGQTASGPINGDFNSDGRVDGVDFVLWLQNYGRTASTPTRNITPTPTISGPSPTLPPIGAVKGVWISQEEIMRLPMSGSAWDNVRSTANSNWGSPCLYDNNCNHDVYTLAGALYAARTGDSAMRAKVIDALNAATGSNLSRVLELSRGLQTYIIAADIIGYHSSSFDGWVRRMMTESLTGHSGGGNLLETAKFSANNWGGHSRACVAAAAVYLGDSNLMSAVVTAYKAFIGVQQSSLMVYTSTSWHADSSNKAGENRKGSVKNGITISGVLPEDWRRAAEFQWPPSPSGYMWEGMQGYIVTGIILHRAGQVSLALGDYPIKRAMDILYHRGEATVNPSWTYPASGDDTWIPWVVNYYFNESYPTNPASSGKNMGYTDWTHAR